eukprot:g3560.t1
MADTPTKSRNKRKIVSTKPTTSEGLTFTLVPHIDSVSTLSLTNRCNKAIAFKVKTNNTDRYLVQPNQGVIVQGGDAQIQIFCLTKNVNDMLTQSFQQLKKYEANDKFLVQTRTVEANMMKYLMEKSGSPEGMNEVSEQLSQLFAKTPENKQKIQNLKYSVNFESDHWMQPVTSPAETGGEDNAFNANPAEVGTDAQTTNNGNTSEVGNENFGTSSNNTVEVEQQDNGTNNNNSSNNEDNDSEQQQSKNATTNIKTSKVEDTAKMVENEDAGKISNTSTTTTNPVSNNNVISNSSKNRELPPNYDFEKIERDMATLRKKYDELLKWTLQLTGERDQLQKLTNKLTQENTKLRLVADMKRDEAMNITKDLIKKDNESNNTKLNDDALAEKFKKREENATSGSGYSMFTILAVAVLSFFVGRMIVLYQNSPQSISKHFKNVGSSG